MAASDRNDTVRSWSRLWSCRPLLLAWPLVACTSNPGPARGTIEVAPTAQPKTDSTPKSEPPADDGVLELEATVRIDAGASAKRLDAVWLELGDGERWFVAYRREGWLAGFANRRVRVTGSRHAPAGHAVVATHFRIDTLVKLNELDGGHHASVGPEATLTGSFVERVGEVGTKLEGERYPMFTTAAGAVYALANRPEGMTWGASVTVRAREMTYSKFVAHGSGPMIWVLAIEAATPPEPAATKPSEPAPPYAQTHADLDGDGTVETITIGNAGSVTIGAAPPLAFDWIHPTNDYWGGLDREQRLAVTRLDATHQAVVFWQFEEGDVDPDKRFHVYGYWDGAIHPLIDAPIEVAHAAEFAASAGKLLFVEDGCVRDATIIDGRPANDGESHRVVRTFRWKPKLRKLVAASKTTKTRSRCLMAACPFVEVGTTRVGEILRRLSEPELDGVQSLRLPAFAGGLLEVALVEAKPEVTLIRAVTLRVDGVEYQARRCGRDSGVACGSRGRALTLMPGDRATFTFDVPASEDVVLMVEGHYLPL